MRNPVIAQIGIVHMHAFALDQDIVAAFAQQVVVVLATVQHVMAQHARAAERIAHIAHQQVKAVAAFDPVVAFAAKHHLGTGTTKDKVVAVHTKGFCRVVRPHQDGVVAFTAEHQLANTRAAGNHVVAIFAMQEGHIITIADDVIARTAAQGVHTRTADQQVVAIATPQGVIAQAANQLVILRCAAQNHMLAAVELQQVIIAACAIHNGGIHGCGCPLHQGGAHRRQEGINPFRGGICNGLNGLIYLEDIFHRREQIARNAGTTLADVGVACNDRGKRVVFQFRQHVHASRARQVIEAVCVLQVLHLVLEDKAKARPKHATEGHDCLGQAADPEFNIVDPGFLACPCAGGVDEIQPVGRGICTPQHQIGGCGAFFGHSGGRHDGVVGAVGCDKVHNRGRVFQVRAIVQPAVIGFQRLAAGCGIELLACRIQRGHARITATGNVQRGQVQRQANQIVAQGAGQELVDIGTGFAGHAADNRTCRLVRGDGLILVKGHRV